MLNKIIKQLSVIALCLVCTTTYAATNASLWGTVDQPVAPIEQVEQQAAQVQAQQEEFLKQKTICEILTAQPTLVADPASGVKVNEILTQAHNAALPEYKSLLVSTEAASSLYGKWRELYMKTYCGN